MGMFELLQDETIWEEYYNYKFEKNHLTKEEEKDLRTYIDLKEYLPVLTRLQSGDSFSIPEKKQLSKIHSSKKRTVYIYPREENYVLKLLTFLLVRGYDHVFSDNLYSFRVNTGVIKAIRKLKKTSHKYSYKVDISNYFNSIPVDKMLMKLEPLLDLNTYHLFETILLDKRVIFNNQLIEEDKGVMAGTPFAVFLANIYLMDLDAKFKEYTYARYSDDIIVFTDTKEELNDVAILIKDYLKDNGLTINAKKEIYTSPKEPWTFLGFTYNQGTIDISEVSKDKIKAKIRRRARAIKRWQIRKNATNEHAIKAFIRAMNRKFYEASSSHELTWSRWYFPLITTDVSLHEIDLYVQYWIRYLSTGKHTKANYNLRYEKLKELGYISLVHEWYKGKTTFDKL